MDKARKEAQAKAKAAAKKEGFSARHKRKGKERTSFLKKAFSKHSGAIGKAVDLAETLFPGTKRGKEKYAFVVGIINSAVDIPLLNEAQEGALIGEAVEAAVKLFKKAGKTKPPGPAA